MSKSAGAEVESTVARAPAAAVAAAGQLEADRSLGKTTD